MKAQTGQNQPPPPDMDPDEGFLARIVREIGERRERRDLHLRPVYPNALPSEFPGAVPPEAPHGR